MKNLPLLGVIFGVLLVLLGALGYFGGEGVSVTAWIPAFFGLPLLVSSALGLKAAWQKHAMHGASIFALLGFFAPLGRMLPQAAKGEFSMNLAGFSMVLMVLLCGLFFVLCFKFFIEARKARTAVENGGEGT